MDPTRSLAHSRPRPLPPACMSPSSHASLWTRQSANTFNQPLSFDTSRNTNMHYMFFVRSLACRAPQCPVGVFRAHAACTGTTPMPSRHYPLVASIPWLPCPESPVVIRQGASAFNQPLHLDTSSVTKMRGMFRVRPSRLPCPLVCRAPQCPAGPSVHRRRPPRSPAASIPPCRPPMSLGVPWQDASAFNQPLSFDTSSLTDMSQMFSVRTPPHACRAKCPVGSSVHALACTATAPTRLRALPPLPCRPPHAPQCASAVRVGV